MELTGEGNYTITYAVGDTDCSAEAFQNLEIGAAAVAEVLPLGTQCASGTYFAELSNTSTTGGTWSINNGGIIDPNTGEIDLELTGEGNYTITYAVGDTDCSAEAFQNLEIGAAAVAEVLPIGTQCASGTYFAELSNTSTTGGSWSINNGGIIDPNTGEIDLELTGEGSYTVTYSVGEADCAAQTTQNLEIGVTAVAEVLPLGTQCASGSYFAELSNASTAGGTWSINNGGVIDPNTGEIDLELTGEGNYTITYAVGDTDCSAEAFQDLEIGVAAVAEVLPLGTQCASGTYFAELSNASTAGGTWSINNGGVIDANTGEIDLELTGEGSYTVTYSVGEADCAAQTTQNLEIGANAIAEVLPLGTQCASGTYFAELSNISTASGTWSINNGGVIDANTGEIDLELTGEGNYTITYIVGDTDCSAEAFQDLEIGAAAVAEVLPLGTQCASGTYFAELSNNSTTGGTWSINNGGVIDPNTGEIDLELTGEGNYTITYAVGDTDCSAEAFQDLEIGAAAVAEVLPLGTQCASGSYFAELSNASTAGGTWSINNGGVIDANTGEIDLELTGEGNYTITYAVGDTDCSAEAFQNLEIGAAAIAEVLPLGTQCASGSYFAELSNISTAGGIWSINNGGIIDPTTGEIDLELTGEGNYIITYAVGDSDCSAEAFQNLEIGASAVAEVLPLGTQCASGSYFAELSNASTAGGTWSINNGGVIDANTGEVDLELTGEGNYTITYAVGDTDCSAEAFQDLEIGAAAIAEVLPLGTQCASGSYFAELSNASTAGGTWSINNGGTIDPNTGEIDLELTGQGNYTVTYSVGDTDCSAEAFQNLEIGAAAIAEVLPLRHTMRFGFLLC